MSGSLARCASALVGLLLALGNAPCSAERLDVIAEWRTLTFDFPHGFPIHSFIPENNIFTGVTVSEDRIFLAMPRLRTGVPATLGWIPRDTRYDNTISPPIRAFPNWSWHSRSANCTGIISVYRTRLDHCNRLWVLDSGVTTSLDDFRVVCPPKLLVFDLRTDQLLRSITFPPEVVMKESLMTNLAIESVTDGFGYPGSCDDVFVYMSDTVEAGLVVYNSAEDTIWRITHPAMEADTQHSTFNIAGESFELGDALIGLALSPPSHTNRLLYFQPLATDRLFAVPTAALRVGPPPVGRQIPVFLVGYKSSQSAGLVINSRGHVYFSPVSETAVVLWDPLSENSKVVAYNPEWLQFVPDITIPNDGSDVLYLLSNRFQNFFKKILDPREINMRVLRVRPERSVKPFNLNGGYF